jgi:hypothetical protein
MLTRTVVATLAAAVFLGAADLAHAGEPVRRCGAGGTTDTGLQATNVRARVISCATARKVAREARWGDEGQAMTTRIDGRAWRCRTAQAATGTDPGYVATTKVRCSRPSGALVRFALRS